MNNYYNYYYPKELYHWGILGQKWGVRKYQNPDGTLTEAGKKRYYNNDGSLNNRGLKAKNQLSKEAEKRRNDYNDVAKQLSALNTKKKSEKAKPILNADEKKLEKLNKVKEKNIELKNRDINSLSDDELDSLLSRVAKEIKLSEMLKNLEPIDPKKIAIEEAKLNAEYAKYFPKEKTATDKVKDFVSASIAPALTEAGKNIVKNGLQKYGDKMLSDIFKDNSNDEINKLTKELNSLDLTKKKISLENEISNIKENNDMQKELNKISLETKKLLEKANQRKYKDIIKFEGNTFRQETAKEKK